MTPFLYENSKFYRRGFDALGMTPHDIQSVDDLKKWPPVDKKEMVEDLMANPPWGTYTTHDDACGTNAAGAVRDFRNNRSPAGVPL
ncbi:MAG: hypothetical protein Ct9H300mP16_19550 [Pseudomonadota bacterium]|nr:MAG: hypothetical protein Ct9H300mP16_19550 [Pseudomonadota bacterium]